MNIIINTETKQRQIICDLDLFEVLLNSRIMYMQEHGLDASLYIDMKDNVTGASNQVSLVDEK